MSREVTEYLSGEGVSHKAYEDFGPFLTELSAATEKIWLDPNEVSQWVVDLIETKVTPFFREDPIILTKAQKNDAELKGIETAHERDGVSPSCGLVWKIKPERLFLEAHASWTERNPTWVELFGHRGGISGNRDLQRV